MGNLFEWYDFAIYAYMAAILARKFFPDTDEIASLLATFATFGVGFAVRPIGGVVIGHLGDVRGRKTALLLTVFLMALGTAGIGLLPDHRTIGWLAPVLLISCRLVQGFSDVGEWGSSTAFIIEWAPPGRRGLFGSFQQSGVAAGLLLGSSMAAFVNTVLTPAQMSGWGWRVPFLFGALLLPLGLYLRQRTDEPPPTRMPRVRTVGVKPQRGLLLAGKACAFTVLWTVAYYMILTYLPTFTSRFAGLSPVQALWSNSIGLAVLVVAAPLFGAWSDRIGRRPLLLASCVGFMLLTHPLFRLIVARRTPGIVTAAQVVFDLMIALFSGPGVAAIAEMFPTASRLTWMSVGYTVSVTVSGGFAPYVATWLIGATRSPLAPAYYLIAAAATSALVIGLMPESAHAELG